MKKVRINFFIGLFILCFCIGCNQPATDSTPTDNTDNTETETGTESETETDASDNQRQNVETIAKTTIENALTDLEISTEGYTEYTFWEYDSNNPINRTQPYHITLKKLYIKADNSSMIQAHVIVNDETVIEVKNNTLVEKLNQDVRYVYVSQSENILSSGTVSIKSRNDATWNPTQISNWESYRQDYKEYVKGSIDGSVPVQDWVRDFKNPKYMLLKQWDGVQVMTVEAARYGNTSTAYAEDIHYYKKAEISPSTLIPNKTELNNAISTVGINTYEYPLSYSYSKVHSINGFIEGNFYMQCRKDDNTILPLRIFVKRGTSENINASSATVTLYTFSTIVAHTDDRTAFTREKMTGTLKYNGNNLSLNGYTWYKWDYGSDGYEYVLEKEVNGSIHVIKIWENNGNIQKLHPVEIYTAF